MRQAINTIKDIKTYIESCTCDPIALPDTKYIIDLCKQVIAADDKERNKIVFDRINNDVNGNPRYVVHFLQCRPNDKYTYADTVKLMNKIGGRKYHNKSYGGGIVFQSYSTVELENDIVKLCDSKC